MNLPLQRSDIGEVWLQPDLFLVTDLPKEEAPDRPQKSKAISSYNCQSCVHLSNDYCTKGKKFHQKNGCGSFQAYQISCVGLWIGDEVIYYQSLTHFKGWMKGIVASIDQTYITLETGRILPHSKWQLPSPKPANHCTNCNSYDSSVPDSSPWKFCLSKGKYIKEQDLKTCEDFKPIIPYKAPVKKRRSRGDGSGSIVKRCLSKKTKKGVKSYEQYWYDYELWEDGICLHKGSAYIPKNKLEEIENMNNEEKPVKAILERLGKIV
jgi:hypothetical protein